MQLLPRMQIPKGHTVWGFKIFNAESGGAGIVGGSCGTLYVRHRYKRGDVLDRRIGTAAANGKDTDCMHDDMMHSGGKRKIHGLHA